MVNRRDHGEKKKPGISPKDPMQDLRPTIWIGKQGLTDAIIDEIRVQLKQRLIVKVKWLRNADLDPAEMAERAGAELRGVRGRTAVLVKRGSSGDKSGGFSRNI
jgi:RNA-binding protein